MGFRVEARRGAGFRGLACSFLFDLILLVLYRFSDCAFYYDDSWVLLLFTSLKTIAVRE